MVVAGDRRKEEEEEEEFVIGVVSLCLLCVCDRYKSERIGSNCGSVLLG